MNPSLTQSFYLEKQKLEVETPTAVVNAKNFSFTGSPLNQSLNIGMTVDEFVKTNLRKQSFGIEYYNLPKVERAYLLKPL